MGALFFLGGEGEEGLGRLIEGGGGWWGDRMEDKSPDFRSP